MSRPRPVFLGALAVALAVALGSLWPTSAPPASPSPPLRGPALDTRAAYASDADPFVPQAAFDGPAASEPRRSEPDADVAVPNSPPPPANVGSPPPPAAPQRPPAPPPLRLHGVAGDVAVLERAGEGVSVLRVGDAIGDATVVAIGPRSVRVEFADWLFDVYVSDSY